MMIFLASNQQIADPGPTPQFGLPQGASTRAAPKRRVCWLNQFSEYGKENNLCEIYKSPVMSRAVK